MRIDLDIRLYTDGDFSFGDVSKLNTIKYMEVMMKNWMSDNSKNYYGTPNTDEIMYITGRICAIVGLVLFSIFIIDMLT